MPYTNDDWLPSYEELTVPEIQLSSAPLRAAAHHFGKYCDNQCKEYMLCRSEDGDPRRCLNEGKEVTRCAFEFFRKLKKNCMEEFTKYSECVDHHPGGKMEFRECRASQAVYDKCVLDKIGQERPELGYFSKVRLHSTTRPKPVIEPKLPEPSVEPPDMRTAETPESVKYGSRQHFFS